VTDTGAAMCGATGAPTMDPWFRRFELEQSATRTAKTKSSASAGGLMWNGRSASEWGGG